MFTNRRSVRIEWGDCDPAGIVLEGFEARVWVVRDRARPGRFKPQPIPPEIVARLTAS